MSVFKRGLSNNLIDALQLRANDPGNNWWKEVLALAKNKDLLLAVRGGYLNAYAKGQSVFKIGPGVDGGKPHVETHFKYLVVPEMDGGNSYVSFDGKRFEIKPENVVQTSYECDVTLERLVRTAARFSGAEKTGVHKIAAKEPKVVDVEIAFTRDGTDGDTDSDTDTKSPVRKRSSAPRMDIAVLVSEIPNEIRLVFCEAKCADNAELWKLEEQPSPPSPQIAVVGQIRKYEDFIRGTGPDIVEAYKGVCKTLVELSEQGGRKADPLVEEVANGTKLTIHPHVYLLVYDFDADQKKGAVQKRLDELSNFLEHRVIAKGDPGQFKLSEDILRYEKEARRKNVTRTAGR